MNIMFCTDFFPLQKVPFEPWCPFPSATAAASDPNRNLTGSNGQACFWFYGIMSKDA